MINSILVVLLKKMPANILDRFREYLDSPFFNKNEKVKKLGTLVLKKIKNDGFTENTKSELYHAIYDNGAYGELRMNNLVSDVLQLLYRFLGQLEFGDDLVLQQQFTINALQRRGLYLESERPLRKAEKLESKYPYRNVELYQHQFRRLDQMDQLTLTQKLKSHRSFLQEKSDMLDLYFMANKLRLACDMVSRSQVSKATYDCDFLTETIARYQDNPALQKEPALQIYIEILEMFKYADTPEFYKKVRNTLNLHHHCFPQEELHVIYVYLRNYCIQKINKGKGEYYREIQDLFKILLQEKIILQNGYLTEQSFKNIITVGIRLKDFEWAEAVIDDYKNSIDPEKRTNAVAYNLANLYYARQDYTNALIQLHNVAFTDKTYHISTKIIQIKSYFELNETEALIALLTTFRKFLSRNKTLPEYHRLTIMNFLRFTKKIYQLKNSRNRKSKKRFQKEWALLRDTLQQETTVANKDWLEEKLAQAS